MVLSPVTIGLSSEEYNKPVVGAGLLMTSEYTYDGDVSRSLIDSIVEDRRYVEDLDTKLWCQFI